jgi:hypothetical protein
LAAIREARRQCSEGIPPPGLGLKVKMDLELLGPRRQPRSAQSRASIRTEPAIPEIVGPVMQDMRAQLEKLKSEAEYCALISELATDRQKRILFASLSRHLKRLASEVELAIQDKLEKEEG